MPDPGGVWTLLAWPEFVSLCFGACFPQESVFSTTAAAATAVHAMLDMVESTTDDDAV